MGIQVVTIDKQHVCPMKDGNKPHKGGAVIQGVSGVFIDGKPVATVGSKCQCCSAKENSITSGAMGVLIDGKPIALVGSQTEHGGNIIEGVPGVTVSGGFATKSDEPEDFQPQIFNLRWMKGDHIIQSDTLNEDVIFRASTVGFEDGEEVSLELYNDAGDLITETTVVVNNGEVEFNFNVENNHFTKKEDDAKQ